MADRPDPDVELRVMPDNAVVFGPTKAKLLEEVLINRSINAAARSSDSSEANRARV